MQCSLFARWQAHGFRKLGGSSPCTDRQEHALAEDEKTRHHLSATLHDCKYAVCSAFDCISATILSFAYLPTFSFDSLLSCLLTHCDYRLPQSVAREQGPWPAGDVGSPTELWILARVLLLLKRRKGLHDESCRADLRRPRFSSL